MKLPPYIKKSIIVLVVIGLVYGGYSYFFKKNTVTGFTTISTTVKKGNIENSVQVIGTSALVYEQKMQFSQAGKVAKILFKEGASIKKGDIMAELDTTDVLNEIKQQEVSLNNAQIKLAQTIKGATDKDILNGENNITSAKSKITTLTSDRVNILRDKANKQADYESQITAKQNDITSNANDITNKKSQLVITQNELALLEKTEGKGISDSDTDIAKTLDSAIIDAKKQIIDAEASLYNADEILGITDTNRTKNDSYEVYLGSKDPAIKTKVENDWGKANTILAEAKSLLASLPTTNDSTTTKTFLSAVSKLEDTLVTLGKDGTDTINASISSTNFPQSTIDSYANIFTSITSSSQSSLSAVKTTIANLDKLTDPELKKASSSNTLNAKKQSIVDQEYAIKKLEIDTAQKYANDLKKLQSDMQYSIDNYNAQLASKDIDIENAKNTLKYNEASQKLLIEGATKEEIALAKNSIASQKLALEKVKEGIKKYQLEAPFDGVLRKIDFKLGDNIVTSSSATPEYLYIENPNLVEITATVDQLEVVKLKLDQNAKIIFDSFSTLTFTGKVSDINSTPSTTSSVTTYTIKVTMDKGNHQIFSGMSAKVNIVIEGKENALILETSFLEKKNGKTAVLKQTGTASERTDVVTGISNATNTEIVSGVSEGDTILRRIVTSSGSTTKTSLIPTGGGNRSSSSSSSKSTTTNSDAGGPPPGM